MQINKSNMTLLNPDLIVLDSRQSHASHPRLDFDIRTRVEVIKEDMHATSSFTNTFLVDHTPHDYLQGISEKQAPTTKSPTFRPQQPFHPSDKLALK